MFYIAYDDCSFLGTVLCMQNVRQYTLNFSFCEKFPYNFAWT